MSNRNNPPISLEEKKRNFVLEEKNVPFFSSKKLGKIILALFISFFCAIGLLIFIEVTFFPEMGVMRLADNAQRKTNEWLRAKEVDRGHEAIAFEEMLDAYAARGGDISHTLDSMTNEFTAANWAELLEYDVDYFLKHDEINKEEKFNGILHITKILYTSGHYDLFKDGYKILIDKFAGPDSYLTIYHNLLPLQAAFDYDDEEERWELEILYDLELKRHLRLTKNRIKEAHEKGQISIESWKAYAKNVKEVLRTTPVLLGKNERFQSQIVDDMTWMLINIENLGDKNADVELLSTGYELALLLRKQDYPKVEPVIPNYFADLKQHMKNPTEKIIDNLINTVLDNQKSSNDLAEHLNYFQNLKTS